MARRWALEVLAGTVSGVMAAAVLSGITYWQRDTIHGWLVDRDPTCDVPGKLEPLDAPDLSASGPPGSHSDASNAVDGYAGSWWVPDLDDPRRDPDDSHTWHLAHLNPGPESRTLRVTLGEERDVRLVCVVNGLAESRTRYLMHGTVSSVTTWGEQAPDTPVALRRLPAEEMHAFQEAGADLGPTSSVSIRVDAVVSGETVTTIDPDDCFPAAEGTQMDPLADGERPQRPVPEGCIRAPAPYAGIAEVLLYVEP